MLTRRNFIRYNTFGAASLGLKINSDAPLLVHLGRQSEPVPLIQDPRLRELTARALTAARRAGATYADVRLLHTKTAANRIGITQEAINVGVRALVDGYWGFAASSVWSPDEMDRLGREATHQATVNVLGIPRIVDLAPLTTVVKGHWSTPVAIDPFTVHPDEIQDFVDSIVHYIQQRMQAGPWDRTRIGLAGCQFVCREQAFASTEGSFATTRTFLSSGQFQFGVDRGSYGATILLDSLLPASAGWEWFREQPVREEIRRRLAEEEADFSLPQMAVDVGRYAVAVDAKSLSNAVNYTLGAATEIDRVFGYEANGGGTSYLDPAMLGVFRLGSPLLTVRANRTERYGAATVAWDDDGVPTHEFSIIEDGILTDFSTTREGAGWIKSYYQQANRPFQSHGCAVAGSDLFGGMYAPTVGTPNLVVQGGETDLDFEGCVQELGAGLAFRRMWFDIDYQQSGGVGSGKVYEVKQGKRTALIHGAGILFQAPELWKSLSHLGGSAHATRFGFSAEKGFPQRTSYHSVTAPPAVFQDVTVIDLTRKA